MGGEIPQAGSDAPQGAVAAASAYAKGVHRLHPRRLGVQGTRAHRPIAAAAISRFLLRVSAYSTYTLTALATLRYNLPPESGSAEHLELRRAWTAAVRSQSTTSAAHNERCHKLNASSGRRSGQRARKRPAGSAGQRLALHRLLLCGSPHLLEIAEGVGVGWTANAQGYTPPAFTRLASPTRARSTSTKGSSSTGSSPVKGGKKGKGQAAERLSAEASIVESLQEFDDHLHEMAWERPVDEMKNWKARGGGSVRASV